MRAHLTRPTCWLLSCLFLLPGCNSSSGGDPSGAIDLPENETPNAAPVAVDDSYTTDRDTPLHLAAPGLLGNDSDADGDPLTAVLVSGVSNGTLTLNADGSFDYTPAAGFEGTDSFTYVANDGLVDSVAATESIMVNALPFACSQVIGFSQTNQWFTGASSTDLAGFQTIVDNDRWQLLFNGGAGVEKWSDPNYPGWDRPLQAPCVDSAEKPDRVILTISGNLGDLMSDPQIWADEIDRAITIITLKYDSVRQVLLQPVVGGPNDSVCTFNNQEIRASVNHPVIDQAIERVVTNHSVDVAVAAGFSPTVAVCSDYRDTLGHLTPMASDAVGREIGLFYLDR